MSLACKTAVEGVLKEPELSCHTKLKMALDTEITGLNVDVVLSTIVRNLVNNKKSNNDNKFSDRSPTR